MMGDKPNPTTPGPHNHLGAKPRRSPDPQFDRVFGVDAPIIEDLPIEVGSGCHSVAWQLAEHVLRVFASDGRDAAAELMKRLLVAQGFDMHQFRTELAARNLLAPDTAAKVRALDEFVPSGRTN